jgi:filamentous hemagglutinin family protein
MRPRTFCSVSRLALCAWLAGTLAMGPMAVHGDPVLLPSGGTVTAGSAVIGTADSGLTITQQSGKAIINWRDFSIGAGGSVTVQQPGSGSILLNRVTGAGASVIDGGLAANGQVWLLNGNGILFGSGSRIDVGGLLATTTDIRDRDFLAGHYVFDLPSGNPDAAIVNRGSIRAATGGSVVLSAARVANDGLIEARLGQATLGGASAFSVDFDGDNLLRYAITAPVGQTPKDADGKPASALVSNTGTISAAGGTVLMTARAARNVVDNVINTTGMVQATAVSIRGGEVVLDAGDGAMTVSGTLDASGAAAGQQGGEITLTGNRIAVADGTRLDASGDAGGGTVRIGDLNDAASVTVGISRIAADAMGKGNGGTVDILSAGRTEVAASISARGGARGGDGGAVETSGGEIQIAAARVDTYAPLGATGLWRLDPVNVTTDAAYASSIVSALATSNVSVEADNDITVQSPILYDSPNRLAFLAKRNITFQSSVQNTGAGTLIAVAGWDGVTQPSAVLSTAGAFGNNNGGILVGGFGVAGNVAVGSRLGGTFALAKDLSIVAANGYAQLGYQGVGVASGAITAALTGNLVLNGGAGSGRYVQVGHVGSAGNSGAITVTAGENVSIVAGVGPGTYGLVGHGGDSSGIPSGAISVQAEGRVGLTGNGAQIGHAGSATSGSVLLTARGDISLASGSLIRANATGDAIVIATSGRFTSATAATLSASGGGRWLVFLTAAAANVPGGLTASPFYDRKFDFSAGSYAAITSGGNRFVYETAPVVTIAIDNKTKTYGAANPVLTATITGGLPGDPLAGVYTGAPLLATAATVSSGVGDYGITGSPGTLVSDFNYRIQFVDGTMHVDPAILAASLTGTVRKTYDGTDAAVLTSANYTLGGILSGDDVALNLPATGSYDSKDAGLGKRVSFSGLSLMGAAKGNYVLASQSLSAMVGQIDKATLTYVADAASRTYGEPNPVFAGTVTGFLNGDTLASATTGSLIFASPATASSNTGSHAINGLGLSAANYDFVQAAGNANALTITRATLTYLANAVNRAYGQVNPALTGTVTGFVNGDSLASATTGALSFASPATASSSVGSYAINGSGLSATNYGFAQAAGNTSALTINPAILTASLTGIVSKVYDGTDAAVLAPANYVLSGVVGGDAVSLNAPAAGRYDSRNAGSRMVNVSGLSLQGAGAGNYVLAATDLIATIGRIDPKTITATLTGTVQKIYDGTVAAVLGASNYQLSGVVSGDAVTLNNPASGSFDTANTGSGKSVSVSGLALQGANSGNYRLSLPSLSAAIGRIDPRTVTASLTGTVQKVYDGTVSAIVSAANFLLSGVLPGDAVSLNIPAGALYDTPEAGTGKTVNVGGLSLQGAASGNYALASSNLSGAVGVITAAMVVDNSGVVDVLGNSYTSVTPSIVRSPPVSTPILTPPSRPDTPAPGPSDATADIGGDTSDSVASQMGQSLNGVPGTTPSTTSVLIPGVLRQFSPPPGGAGAHGVPPHGQVYSSWGNEAFWQ